MMDRAREVNASACLLPCRLRDWIKALAEPAPASSLRFLVLAGADLFALQSVASTTSFAPPPSKIKEPHGNAR